MPAAPLTLVTIPISHYCEKARWALDLAGLPYREDGHLPLFHQLFTRPRGGRSVPVLVTPDGVLRDSSDILAWIDRAHPIYPKDAGQRAAALALEDRFDEKFGPHIRRVGYFHTLPHKELAMSVVLPGTARWQRPALSPLYPVVRAIMTRGLALTPERTERSTEKVRRAFDEVGAMLADGRRYLVGDAFSAADLTWAALAAPLVCPPEHPVPWPTDATRPETLRPLARELADSPAGQFVLRLYRDHRGAHAALA